MVRDSNLSHWTFIPTFLLALLIGLALGDVESEKNSSAAKSNSTIVERVRRGFILDGEMKAWGKDGEETLAELLRTKKRRCRRAGGSCIGYFNAPKRQKNKHKKKEMENLNPRLHIEGPIWRLRPSWRSDCLYWFYMEYHFQNENSFFFEWQKHKFPSSYYNTISKWRFYVLLFRLQKRFLLPAKRIPVHKTIKRIPGDISSFQIPLTEALDPREKYELRVAYTDYALLCDMKFQIVPRARIDDYVGEGVYELLVD